MRTQLHQHYVRWCYRWIIITGCLAQGHKMLRIFCLKRWVGRPLKILSWKFEAKLTRKKSYGPVAFANCKQDFAFKFVAMDFIINESANDSINKQHDNSEAVDLSLPKGRQKCGDKENDPVLSMNFSHQVVNPFFTPYFMNPQVRWCSVNLCSQHNSCPSLSNRFIRWVWALNYHLNLLSLNFRSKPTMPLSRRWRKLQRSEDDHLWNQLWRKLLRDTCWNVTSSTDTSSQLCSSIISPMMTGIVHLKRVNFDFWVEINFPSMSTGLFQE